MNTIQKRKLNNFWSKHKFELIIGGIAVVIMILLISQIDGGACANSPKGFCE